MGWLRWWCRSRKTETNADVETVDQESSIVKRTALITLSAQLSADSEIVVSEVVLALEHPELYVEQWADRLANRGIEEPIPELAWIALVEALDEQGLVWEIDWKADAEDILFAVHSLLDRRGWHLPSADRQLEQAVRSGGHTYDYLCKLHESLRSHGIVLGSLDINSDSYVLIVFREEEVEEVQQLAKASGYTFHSSFG
ncbi:DUF6630 family protein [Paenibacillus oceani]|uniref:DUF6630 domain-containing protein n=1 Tax=Paenibacillus oceani TaxID=2772510 RepID=A0A927CEE1_9BACL|nr:DUF6630 family protein [Paenibacillus oceani]MBD2865118.1 hypothetical protein [Paenibacillus oceani]